MSLYKQKFNPISGNFNLVPSSTIVTFKDAVANAAALPLTGNAINDGRITNDTGHLYIWSGTAWVDQGDIIDISWDAIDGKPSSSPTDIDNAVSLRHSNSLDHVQNTDIVLQQSHPDIYATSLLHCDTLTDELGHVVSLANTATLVTTEHKFGTGALSVNNGQGFDFAWVQFLSNLVFGTNDFTIDLWVKPGNLNTASYLSFKHVISGYGNFTINLYNGTWRVGFFGGDTGWQFINCGCSMTINQWNHLAVVKSGSSLIFYENGLAIGSIVLTGTALNVTCYDGYKVGAGEDNLGGSPSNDFIDEVRISNGIARWTSNFIVPTAPYDVLYAISDVINNGTLKNDLPVDTGITIDGRDISADGAILDANQITISSMLEDIKNNSLNILLNAFRIAQIGSLTIFSMVKGFMDEFEDESGIDLINSVNQTYNSVDDYYKNYTEIDAETTFLLHLDGDVTDSSSYAQIVFNTNVLFPINGVFNGSSSFLTVPASSDYSFGTNDFTIELLAKSAYNGQAYLISVGKIGSGDHVQFDFNDTGNGILIWGTGISMMVGASGAYTDGLWHHYALVRNGNDLFFYIDGVQVATQAFTASFDVSETLLIGATQDGSSTGIWNWNGGIDEVRISNGIARYTSAFVPPVTPFVNDSYTKLLLHLDDNVNDSETIPKTISNTDVTFEVTNKKFGTTAARFNGVDSSIYIPNSTNLAFGTEDFTIDFWLKSEEPFKANTRLMLDNQPQNVAYGFMSIGLVGASVRIICDVWLASVITTGQLIENEWNHIAVVRASGVIKIYINGVNNILDTVTYAGDLYKQVSFICAGSPSTETFNGYLDEIRFSKGIARWTSDFSVPTKEYLPETLTMDLISNSQTATSTPTEARIVLFEEDVEPVTLNTDLKAYVSRDNGTTFTEVTLEDEGNYVTSARVLSGVANISSQPSGTDVVYKIKASNNKLKLHGVGLSWK